MDWVAIIEASVALSGMGGLIFYRLKKRFKNEPVKTWKDWLDRNLVELAIAGVIVPDWNLILKLIPGAV